MSNDNDNRDPTFEALAAATSYGPGPQCPHCRATTQVVGGFNAVDYIECSCGFKADYWEDEDGVHFGCVYDEFLKRTPETQSDAAWLFALRAGENNKTRRLLYRLIRTLTCADEHDTRQAFVFFMSTCSPEERQLVTRELASRIPEMLIEANKYIEFCKEVYNLASLPVEHTDQVPF